MTTPNIVPTSIDELSKFNGISTKCFTYNAKSKTFTIEMSELGFVDGDEFLVQGKLCRSNGQININTANSYGSIVLTSHRTGVKAFFTFEKEERDAEHELIGVYYKYFGASNDPLGKNPNMRFVKIFAIND